MRGRPFDRAYDILPPTVVFWTRHYHVHRSRVVGYDPSKRHLFLTFRSLEGHHNEQIDVAVGSSFSSSM